MLGCQDLDSQITMQAVCSLAGVLPASTAAVSVGSPPTGAARAASTAAKGPPSTCRRHAAAQSESWRWQRLAIVANPKDLATLEIHRCYGKTKEQRSLRHDAPPVADRQWLAPAAAAACSTVYRTALRGTRTGGISGLLISITDDAGSPMSTDTWHRRKHQQRRLLRAGTRKRDESKSHRAGAEEQLIGGGRRRVSCWLGHFCSLPPRGSPRCARSCALARHDEGLPIPP